MPRKKQPSPNQSIAGGCLRCGATAIQDGCHYLIQHFHEIDPHHSRQEEIDAHRLAINEHINALFKLAGA